MRTLSFLHRPWNSTPAVLVSLGTNYGRHATLLHNHAPARARTSPGQDWASPARWVLDLCVYNRGSPRDLLGRDSEWGHRKKSNWCGTDNNEWQTKPINLWILPRSSDPAPHFGKREANHPDGIMLMKTQAISLWSQKEQQHWQKLGPQKQVQTERAYPVPRPLFWQPPQLPENLESNCFPLAYSQDSLLRILVITKYLINYISSMPSLSYKAYKHLGGCT